MKWLITNSAHIWGFCGAFWGAYGVWAWPADIAVAAIAVSVVSLGLAAMLYNLDRP